LDSSLRNLSSRIRILLTKFVDCLFVVTAIYNTYNNLFIEPFKSSLFWAFVLLNPIMTIFGFLFCVIFPFIWQRKENTGKINSDKLRSWIVGIIRYWLAACICIYGFAKILKTQFAHSISSNDSLVRSLSGFDLTWNYFGHSYALAVIIALFQIGGSLLLLFRRTTLLGAILLFPVMLNILLINWFYDINTYAFLNSILYSLGLLYLLLFRWKDIKSILFKPVYTFPAVRLGFVKYFIRFLVIAIPLGVIYHYANTDKPSFMVGKWHVDQMVRNNITLKSTAWLTDSTAWKNIYFEKNGAIVISSNPYVIDMRISPRGRYIYDSTFHLLVLALGQNSFQKDSLVVKVDILNNKQMKWDLVNHNDSILLQMSKVEDKKQ
jgi:hypothetical protein